MLKLCCRSPLLAEAKHDKVAEVESIDDQGNDAQEAKEFGLGSGVEHFSEAERRVKPGLAEFSFEGVC